MDINSKTSTGPNFMNLSSIKVCYGLVPPSVEKGSATHKHCLLNPTLPYHGKLNKVRFLAKLNYDLEMIIDDDIYLLRLQTFSFLHLNPEIGSLQNYNCVGTAHNF